MVKIINNTIIINSLLDINDEDIEITEVNLDLVSLNEYEVVKIIPKTEQKSFTRSHLHKVEIDDNKMKHIKRLFLFSVYTR